MASLINILGCPKYPGNICQGHPGMGQLWTTSEVLV